MAWATSGSALPPDVRRWLCPAVPALYIWAVPLVRPLAQLSDGLSPDQGPSPKIILAAIGGAEPPPHIRRQSRSHGNESHLGQSCLFTGAHLEPAHIPTNPW